MNLEVARASCTMIKSVTKQMKDMQECILVHKEGDFVGVATEDINSGREAIAVFMDTGRKLSVRVLENVPLGHKVALRKGKIGDQVVEYGEPIGVATKDFELGQHIHTHNLKSTRW